MRVQIQQQSNREIEAEETSPCHLGIRDVGNREFVSRHCYRGFSGTNMLLCSSRRDIDWSPCSFRPILSSRPYEDGPIHTFSIRMLEASRLKNEQKLANC
jgi:hypothetical protein